MENAIRRALTLAVMFPKFIHFHQKIGFKSVLESKTSVSRHLGKGHKKLFRMKKQDLC